jgi:hypothetical protein
MINTTNESTKWSLQRPLPLPVDRREHRAATGSKHRRKAQTSRVVVAHLTTSDGKNESA